MKTAGPDTVVRLTRPHADDEVYVVLEGSGVLEVEGESVPVSEGRAVFVRGRRRAPL
jgi:mannose-6-phosphate isomerase-like protein (cupin superfamily)